MSIKVLLFLSVGTIIIWTETSITPSGPSKRRICCSACRIKLAINGLWFQANCQAGISSNITGLTTASRTTSTPNLGRAWGTSIRKYINIWKNSIAKLKPTSFIKLFKPWRIRISLSSKMYRTTAMNFANVLAPLVRD